MDGIDEAMLARPIQLVDEVIINADSAQSFKQECVELKTVAIKLAALLREAVHACNELYERPAPRILDHIEQVLDNALALVTKCGLTSYMRQIFFIVIPNNAFKETSTELENSTRDVSWLLHVSAPAKYPNIKCFPRLPICSKDYDLAHVWEDIAMLRIGTLARRSYAAESLGSLAHITSRCGGLIIEEGGVPLLLKLVKEGRMEGQEKAVRAIGFMCRNSKNVEDIVNCGTCSVFAKLLEDGHRKVQSVVAWAVSEMAAHRPECQDDFVKNNVIKLLINHLFGTMEEHHQQQHDQLQNSTTKVQMKVMAAIALRHLCKGNVNICLNIIHDSKAFMCFDFLLQNDHADVKYYSAIALMEIAATAEQNVELRQSGFDPTSPGVKAIVEQFLKIIEKQSYDLLITSIKAIGHLAWIFKATETRMIASLVKLLDKRSVEDIVIEAVIALDKFACPDNFLHENHCKAIIEEGGIKHLIQLVQFGELVVQIPSLILLCHIILHVHDSEVLTQEEVLTTLEKSSKNAKLMEEPNIQNLLPEAKSRMKLYQSKGSKWISLILTQNECPR